MLTRTKYSTNIVSIEENRVEHHLEDCPLQIPLKISLRQNKRKTKQKPICCIEIEIKYWEPSITYSAVPSPMILIPEWQVMGTTTKGSSTARSSLWFVEKYHQTNDDDERYKNYEYQNVDSCDLDLKIQNFLYFSPFLLFF